MIATHSIFCNTIIVKTIQFPQSYGVPPISCPNQHATSLALSWSFCEESARQHGTTECERSCWLSFCAKDKERKEKNDCLGILFLALCEKCFEPLNSIVRVCLRSFFRTLLLCFLSLRNARGILILISVRDAIWNNKVQEKLRLLVRSCYYSLMNCEFTVLSKNSIESSVDNMKWCWSDSDLKKFRMKTTPLLYCWWHQFVVPKNPF